MVESIVDYVGTSRSNYVADETLMNVIFLLYVAVRMVMMVIIMAMVMMVMFVVMMMMLFNMHITMGRAKLGESDANDVDQD